MQLYTMESSLLDASKGRMVKKPIIVDKIDQIDGKGVYCAHYGQDSNTLIAMTEQGCYIRTIKEKENKKISNIGFERSFDDSIYYKKIGVGLDGKKVVAANGSIVSIFDANTGKEYVRRKMSSPIYSVCFDSKNDHILVLPDRNFFKKYRYENGNLTLVDEIYFDVDSKVNFAINKKILSMNIDKFGSVVKLYNSDEKSYTMFKLEKRYSFSELLKLANQSVDKLDYTSCQISDDGLVALGGINKMGSPDATGLENNRILIFKITDTNELTFKCFIDCKGSFFCNTLFYPTTSVLITVSQLSETSERFIQYWDVKTGKCLYEALIDDGTHQLACAFGNISSISVCPKGENIAITTYYSECIIYKVPGQVAYRHAKSDVLYRLFFLQQLCLQHQEKTGCLTPQEIRCVIARNMFLDLK